MTINPNSSQGVTGQWYPSLGRRNYRAGIAGLFNRSNDLFIQVAVGIAEGDHLLAKLALQVLARPFDLDPTLFHGETGESGVGTSVRLELDAVPSILRTWSQLKIWNIEGWSLAVILATSAWSSSPMSTRSDTRNTVATNRN